ncbi:ClbS/DfsB family four-helix bundle protein [Demequina globuliformis]|uniref:ClbS/DfsB family four-helix bundle protein n=1 Tax=Demequina globuliformis TaxID=676202 RepID=UPI00078666B5|nr:ClbS/DfsB family four-helix bundle protein [Demequina globuliformis]
MSSTDAGQGQPATPATMAELVADADTALEEFLHAADSRPDHAVSDAFAGSRVADIFAHLTGWHELFVGWITTDARGATPAFPAPGYEWEQLAELNMALIDRHRHRSYDDLRRTLVDSHARVREVLLAQREESVFDRNAHAWLGDESLAFVAHECLGHHYRWGITMLGECAAP